MCTEETLTSLLPHFPFLSLSLRVQMSITWCGFSLTWCPSCWSSSSSSFTGESHTRSLKTKQLAGQSCLHRCCSVLFYPGRTIDNREQSDLNKMGLNRGHMLRLLAGGGSEDWLSARAAKSSWITALISSLKPVSHSTEILSESFRYFAFFKCLFLWWSSLWSFSNFHRHLLHCSL